MLKVANPEVRETMEVEDELLEELERKEKEEAKRSAKQEREEKINTKIKLAKLMKEYGKSIDEIIKETGLSKKEIEQLLK